MTVHTKERCKKYRKRILEISQKVGAAHVAPAFSCMEIVDTLYNEIMRDDDIFIMSKGHGCLAQYVILEERGRISKATLDAYCTPDGKLGAHPDYNINFGVHASTGSLGHGLGIAAGQAYAEKIKGSLVSVYVLLSDGECQAGSTWEAAMVAANLGIHNLVAVVDYNDFGGMERMSEAFRALSPITAKFEAFGWGCANAAGHDTSDLRRAILSLRALSPLDTECSIDWPGAVICHTTKGKGVSFMENEPIWHYRSPSAEEYEKALMEIENS